MKMWCVRSISARLLACLKTNWWCWGGRVMLKRWPSIVWPISQWVAPMKIVHTQWHNSWQMTMWKLLFRKMSLASNMVLCSKMSMPLLPASVRGCNMATTSFLCSWRVLCKKCIAFSRQSIPLKEMSMIVLIWATCWWQVIPTSRAIACLVKWLDADIAWRMRKWKWKW